MAIHDYTSQGHGREHSHGHAHEHCLKMARREDGTPWWTAFPDPASAAVPVAPGEVFQLLRDQETAEDKHQHFLLVDVRRADCKGGTVRGAINLPAHSFYPTRKSLYNLCKQAGIQTVILYCGSSLGRGPRCAAWLQDYVDEVDGDLKSKFMTGGIRGWVQAYGGNMMDGYDEKAWEAEGK